MKQRLAPISAVVLALLVACGIAAASPAHADVNDFTFDSMTATYELSRTPSGESQMRVVETLVAQFPEADQNHGIIRAIPTSSHDRPVGLEFVRVTDGDGVARDFTTNEADGFLEVTVAAPDYVHGAQTYVFEYLEHNVILSRAAAVRRRSFTGM